MSDGPMGLSQGRFGFVSQAHLETHTRELKGDP
jgi:hypothetical protein